MSIFANKVERDSTGVQVTAVTNFVDLGELTGVQVSGCYNSATWLKGVQLSLVNRTQGYFKGLQFGLLNMCEGEVDGSIGSAGVQIGLLNMRGGENVKWYAKVIPGIAIRRPLKEAVRE